MIDDRIITRTTVTPAKAGVQGNRVPLPRLSRTDGIAAVGKGGTAPLFLLSLVVSLCALPAPAFAMHISEGIGLAINAGDLALALVCGTVVHDPGLDGPTKIRVLAELVDMTTRTIEGQALDIGWARDGRFDLTIDDYLTMANHKTAFYSGGVPLAVGAIIGGGSTAQVETLRAFGMAAGLAFQIQDDVLNLCGTAESTKKDFRSDITEGKRTLVAIHALLNAARRERLLEILSAHSVAPAVLAEAVEIMGEAGSIEFARTYARDLIISAKDGLIEAVPPSPARELLGSMADFFVERSS